MNALNLTYSQLWSIYRRSRADVQQDILQQLNIEEVLQYATIEIRKEILSNAPPEVIRLYQPHVPSHLIDRLRRELYETIRR